MGVLNSDLFAIESLRIASNKAVKHLFPKSPKVYFTDKYQIKDTNTVYLKMNYGSAEILNPKSLINKKRDKRPRVVDLVMTLYPSDLQNWEEDYKELISKRLASLEDLDSAFSMDRSIKWNLIIQDEDQSLYKAKKRVHGVVIHYSPLKSDYQKEKYNQTLRKMETHYSAQVEGKRMFEVVKRNKENWKNMLVITDCSGSMAPYGSEVLLWHLLRTDKDDVSKFAFFNDGEKESIEIGNAGGIHFTSIKDYRKITRAIKYYTELGYDKNNDHPENDLEAIIKSVNSSYSHQDVVVIVDNNSPVRDMELLNKINYPVRIVLCGVEKKEDIHPDYIKLAFHSKGSLHTVEDDIDQFMKNKEGEIVMINKVKYRVEEDELVQVSKKIKIRH
tara:strand:+ start:312 stop:1475 length:1164 start_codon:yes stop_codon:yes gene_type:complete